MSLVIDLAAWILRVVLVVLSGYAPVVAASADVVLIPPVVIHAADEPTIHEDSPDWDCATMGNQICGPATELPEPTIEAVVACAESRGGLTDGNLAACSDLLGLPCGIDPRVDAKRADC